TTTSKLVIKIMDANDLPPLFSSEIYNLELAELTEPHTSVLQLSASDPDLGINSRIYYGITNTTYTKYFAVHQATGSLSLIYPISFKDIS
ncbi:hypothetical protein HELRODRAFT_147079, partial [Helobdella robusta]|uniref:Cadherin domain-containing protein n=1 Tax=Helobdella robusta TaxID=6412 RepID=T1EJW7_HELRO